jgi:di/tripeptidase
MNKDRFKELLSLPSYTGSEQLIREFIVNFGFDNNIVVHVDDIGNVYLIKGTLDEGEYYPCIAAHMDTVYQHHLPLIETNNRLVIMESQIPNTFDNTIKTILYAENNGIGGDDKCGIAICLELILKCDKLIAAFFVEEEFGCKGSKNADKTILDKVGYFIEFDAPTDNWCSEFCSGIKLYNDEMFDLVKPVFQKYNVDNFSNDPYTDVAILRCNFDVCCLNVFAGYYNQHSNKREFIFIEDVEKSIDMGYELLTTVGNNKMFFERAKR